jgi:hypothetical protein
MLHSRLAVLLGAAALSLSVLAQPAGRAQERPRQRGRQGPRPQPPRTRQQPPRQEPPTPAATPTPRQQQQPPAAVKPAPPESWWQTLLRVAGISVAPSRQKGGDPVESGDIWVHSLATRSSRRMTSGGGYRSPVFLARDEHLLALKGGAVVRIPLSGGPEQRLFADAAIVKLVGVFGDSPDEVLAVRRDEGGRFSLASLSLPDSRLAVVPHETESEAGRLMLAEVLGWDRTYCNTTVYVEEECDRDEGGRCRADGAGRTRVWTDVKFRRAYADPLNVSNGRGANSGQPSLSLDGQSVAYVTESLARPARHVEAPPAPAPSADASPLGDAP